MLQAQVARRKSMLADKDMQIVELRRMIAEAALQHREGMTTRAPYQAEGEAIGAHRVGAFAGLAGLAWQALEDAADNVAAVTEAMLDARKKAERVPLHSRPASKKRKRSVSPSFRYTEMMVEAGILPLPQAR